MVDINFRINCIFLFDVEGGEDLHGLFGQGNGFLEERGTSSCSESPKRTGFGRQREF